MESELVFYLRVAFLFPFPSCFLSSRIMMELVRDDFAPPLARWVDWWVVPFQNSICSGIEDFGYDC